MPRPRPATRVVALLLVAVTAAGADLAPSAGAGGCRTCVLHAVGRDCCADRVADRTSESSRGDDCCAPAPAEPESPPDPSNRSSHQCACACSHCCLPIGRAPATDAVDRPPCAPAGATLQPPPAALERPPAGVHSSVFHPPRA